MRIAGNVPFPDARPHPVNPVFANKASHWWDGSEVYGTDAAQADRTAGGSEAPAQRRRATCRRTPAGRR